MKKIILIVFTVLLTINFNWSQGLKTSGKKIVDKQGNEVLLRGMGPGGWLVMEGYMNQSAGIAGPQHVIKNKLIELMGKEKTETFFKEWRKNHFTKRDVDSLAAWGFNSIRIPMHYNLMTLPIEDEPVDGQNTWIEEGFTIIDNVLEWAKPHNMYVIMPIFQIMTVINLHFGKVKPIKRKRLLFGEKLLNDTRIMNGSEGMI